MRSQNRQQFRSVHHVKVSNPRNGALIGYVEDVSESGLKVLGDAPFVQDEHLRMQMRVPDETLLLFDLDATCKWSGSNTNNGYYEAGFSLEHPCEEFTLMVELLRTRNSKTESTEH